MSRPKERKQAGQSSTLGDCAGDSTSFASSQSEWAARAHRSLKFWQMQINVPASA